MDVHSKRILVTGGSSGIGLATAQALGAKGARLLLTARRSGPLQAAVEQLTAAGIEAHGLAADVATGDGRAATLAAARDRLGGLDVLINNAGGVRAGRLEDTSEDEIRAMIEVDLLAPILLTRAALPDLRRSGDGMVVNITSAAALIGMPFYATYAAAKAGLARFGEAMRRELKGEGVHLLTVYPGATDTQMMATSQAGPEVGFSKEPVSAVADAIVDGIVVGALLDQVNGPVASFTADGAYDQDSVYGQVAAHYPEASVIVLPRSSAVPSNTAQMAPTMRDRHLQIIAERGRIAWQKASGYHWRALVETDISRFKRVIGDGLRFGTDRRRATEVAIAAGALHRILELGRPEYVRPHNGKTRWPGCGRLLIPATQSLRGTLPDHDRWAIHAL